MIFCGQCGLQLAPGTTICPRCSTIVEELKADIDASHANDNTTAGQSISHLSQAGSIMPGAPPQQLVLRPGTTTGGYNPQDATSMMEASYAPAGMSAPGMTNQMGYPPQQNTGTSNGNPTLRVAGLMIVLFGILLMLSAVILFVMQQSGTI
jgi:hypothetical protein